MSEKLPVGVYLVVERRDPDPRVYVSQVDSASGGRVVLCSFKTWDAAEDYCREIERARTSRGVRIVAAIRAWLRR